jgi:hypothetical protein
MSNDDPKNDCGIPIRLKTPDSDGHVGYLISALISLLGVIGFSTVWNVNHWIALFLFAAAISIVSIYISWRVEHPTAGCYFSVVIFVSAGLLDWYIGPIPLPGPDANRPHLSLIEVSFVNQPLAPARPLSMNSTIVNTGRNSAKISADQFNVMVTFGSATLPEKPAFGNSDLHITGQVFNPSAPVHILSPTSMTLTQEQVDAVNAGTAHLYFYGYLKYGTDSVFAFLCRYEPTLGHGGVFVSDTNHPTYSREE